MKLWSVCLVLALLPLKLASSNQDVDGTIGECSCSRFPVVSWLRRFAVTPFHPCAKVGSSRID